MRKVVEEIRTIKVRSTVVARALRRGTRRSLVLRDERGGGRWSNEPGIRDSRVCGIHQSFSVGYRSKSE